MGLEFVWVYEGCDWDLVDFVDDVVVEFGEDEVFVIYFYVCEVIEGRIVYIGGE